MSIERSVCPGDQGAASPSRHAVLAVVDPPHDNGGGAQRSIPVSKPTGAELAGRTVPAFCFGRDRHDPFLWDAPWSH